MNDPYADPVLGKVVIDVSRKYLSIYLCEGDGAIKDFEHVKWSDRLEVKDARAEARNCFDFMYQWALDNLVGGSGLQEGGGGSSH